MEVDFNYSSPYSDLVNRSKNVSHLPVKFTIKNISIYPSRKYGYQQQVMRSFTSNLSTGDSTRVVNEILQTGGKLGHSSMSTSNILRIGAAPLAAANIIGGWGAPRYGFKMEVRVDPNDFNSYGGLNNSYDLILTGYTDPSNDFIIPTSGGQFIINEELPFHINNMQRVSINTNTNTVVGVETIGITDPQNHNTVQANVCVRPSDIISGINSELKGQMYAGGVYTVSATADIAPASFDRKQTVGKQYINQILNSVVDGVSDAMGAHAAFNDAFNTAQDHAITEASSRLRNDVLTTDLFIAALDQVTLSADSVMFCIKHLYRLDPTFNHDRITYANVIEDNRFDLDGLLNSSNTAALITADRLTAKVSELHNIIIALLTNNFLASLEIRIKNQYSISPLGFGKSLTPSWMPLAGGNSFSWIYTPAERHGSVMLLLNNNITSVVNGVIDPLMSENGNLEYDIVIKSDISADTSIAISINNSEPVLYRFPTFSDMAFTPLLATHDVKQQLVTNTHTLVNELTNALSSDPVDYVSHNTHGQNMYI